MKTLEQRVHAKNELNKAAIRELTVLMPQLDKLKGIKCININDAFTKKYTISKAEQPATPLKDGFISVDTWLKTKFNGSILLTVKVCVNGGKYEDNTYYCVYVQEDYFVCRAENGIITDIDNLEDIIDLNKLSVLVEAETEQAKVNEIKALRETINKLESSLLIKFESYELR